MTWHYALSDLVIPPLGFAWLALIATLAAMRGPRPHNAALLISAASTVLLLIFSIPMVGTSLLISLEHGLPERPPPNAPPPRAIVILSAEAMHSIDGPMVGRITLERLKAGARLYRRTRLPILVSGGAEGDGDTTHAALMAQALVRDFGVPVRWQEGRSRTTWENAEFSAAILRPLGIGTVYVVTSAWHERRAILAFRHFGLIPVAAPVPPDALGHAFIPSPGGLSRSFYALHEWLGLLFYRLKAWRAPDPIASSNSAT